MADGQRSAARLLGEDPHSDIAVLRTTDRLAARAVSGDSKSIRVASWPLPSAIRLASTYGYGWRGQCRGGGRSAPRPGA